MYQMSLPEPAGDRIERLIAEEPALYGETAEPKRIAKTKTSERISTQMQKNDRINLHIKGNTKPLPGIVTGDPVQSTFTNRAGQSVATTLLEVITFRIVPEGRPGAGLQSYRRTMESLGFISKRFDLVPGLDDLSARGLEEEVAKSIVLFQNGPAVEAVRVEA